MHYVDFMRFESSTMVSQVRRTDNGPRCATEHPSDQLHSEIKEGYSFADCKSHPREIRPRAATRCSVEGSALGRLRALFRVHLKIIRLSGPPALK